MSSDLILPNKAHSSEPKVGTFNKGYLYALAAVAIWSGFILVSRQGGISTLNAYDVIAIRYTTCALLLFPFWLFWRRFNLLDTRLIMISLIGGLGYALFAFSGFERAPASHAAVLLPGALPLFVTLIALVLTQEKISKQKYFGITAITLGMLILLSKEISNELGTSNQLTQGHLMLLAAAACWGLFSVLVKRWQLSPWEVTVSLAMITCLIYLPIYIFLLPKQILMSVDTHQADDILLQAFYQGFMATIVQMLLYVKAVQLIGAANMGSLMAIVPILAGFSAIPIFNEAVSFELLIAMTLVSIGVLLANTSRLTIKNA